MRWNKVSISLPFVENNLFLPDGLDEALISHISYLSLGIGKNFNSQSDYTKMAKKFWNPVDESSRVILQQNINVGITSGSIVPPGQRAEQTYL